MLNVAAPFWNRIGQQGPLRTALGRKYFHLSQDQLTQAMQKQREELEAKGVDPEVAAAYEEYAPQVAEKEAIDRYSRRNPMIRGALPEITSLNEALLMAQRSNLLDVTQTEQLRGLLVEAMQHSPLTGSTRSADELAAQGQRDLLPDYGTRNTLFTAEDAQAARERLRAKLGRVSAGVDPEDTTGQQEAKTGAAEGGGS